MQKAAANATVFPPSSKSGLTSQRSTLIVFGWETIRRMRARARDGASPNGDGALTPGAAAALMASMQMVNITAS